MAQEFARAFYKSREWQAVRSLVLLRDKGLCIQCGQPAEEVHHIIHLTRDNIWDTSVTLNPDNLASLCRECHMSEHRQDKATAHIVDQNKRELCQQLNSDYTFDEFGQLVRKLASPR